jgi:circadian clock protein KaiC
MVTRALRDYRVRRMDPARRVSTGIEGLDHILDGGLPAGRFHLIQGNPGSGKTTLALQFLLEGVRQGERVLYVTLSETREELNAVAASHGWDLSAVPVFELASGVEYLDLSEQNTLFEPSEIELAEVTRKLLAEVERVDPVRIVFDSLSELRLLAQSALRYRRQLLAFKQQFAARRATVLMADDRTSEGGDLQLQSLAHGVISLEQLAPLYGAERRRLRVGKMRGVAFRGGYHDFRIVRGGLRVFERLVAAEHEGTFEEGPVPSGIPQLDELLGGGLDRGTSALFMGPAGAGKSVLAMQYVVAATARGHRASIYAFDEGTATLLARGRALGMPIDEHLASGHLNVHQIDPAGMSPGELVDHIRDEVERRNARVIVLDSLNGYIASMPEEQFVIVQLHELLSFLRQHGVLAILTVAQTGLIGPMNSPIDVSYLADTVVLLRFFEARGEVRKALSVLKRRTGPHQSDIRELFMDRHGVRIEVRRLSALRGVLTGTPVIEEEEN